MTIHDTHLNYHKWLVDKGKLGGWFAVPPISCVHNFGLRIFGTHAEALTYALTMIALCQMRLR
jgi:hypothetical protein